MSIHSTHVANKLEKLSWPSHNIIYTLLFLLLLSSYFHFRGYVGPLFTCTLESAMYTYQLYSVKYIIHERRQHELRKNHIISKNGKVLSICAKMCCFFLFFPCISKSDCRTGIATTQGANGEFTVDMVLCGKYTNVCYMERNQEKLNVEK